MKKRITSVLMALALCLTLLPTAALADDGTVHNDHCLCGATHNDSTAHTSESKAFTNAKRLWVRKNGDGTSTLMKGTDEWKVSDVKLWKPADGTKQAYVLDNGTYYLDSDFNFTGNTSIKDTDECAIAITGDVTLCLNGHSITCTGKWSAISVYAVDCGRLTLTNCKSTGKITGGSVAAVDVRNGKTFNMYGGTLVGTLVGSSKGYGVNVAADDSKTTMFNMYSGTITGDGDGVRLDNTGTKAKFTMSGGMISNNGGRGVLVLGGTFEMSGGEITGNTTTNGNGGGVSVGSNGTFTMNAGAKITQNTAGRFGGGVCVDGGTFTMTGGEITGNSTTGQTNSIGGGVCVYSGEFTMSGGKISNNTADIYGGGVYVNTNGTFTVSGTPTITDNTQGEAKKANNVHLYNNTIAIGEGGLTEKGSTKPQIGVTVDSQSTNVPTDGKPVAITSGATADLHSYFKADDESKYQIGYESGTNQVQLEAVPKIDLSGATVTLERDSFVFDGKSHTPTVTSVMLGNKTLVNDDYTVSVSSKTNAGRNYKLTITGTGKYTGSVEKTWEITPLIVSVSKVTLKDKVYDGTTAGSSSDVASVIFNNVPTQPEYTIESVTYTDANAGTGTKKADIVIKLKENGNYIFADADENKWTNTTVKTDCTITKANAPEVKPYNLSVVNNKTDTYTLNLSELLPKPSDDCNYGEITYAVVKGTFDLTNSDYYGGGTSISKDGTLTLPIKAADSVAVGGQISTGQVKVTTQNYEDITLTINVIASATNKIVPTGKPTLTPNEPTYGQTLSAIKLSGKMMGGDTPVEGTFEWQNPDFKLDAVGSCEASWKFTPKDGNTYAVADGTVMFTVKQAKPTGEPIYTKITAANKKLADADLKPNSSWPEGKLQWVDKDTGKPLPDTTEVKANTAYKWYFTPTGAAAKNYTVADGTVTLYSVSGGGSSSGGGGGGSSGGGGGGSSSVTTVKTNTVTNPDGSVTKIETKSDGTVVATTTAKDGSVTKTTTKKDGSSVTENKAADGSTGTVKTDKNGQTEANAKVSAKAVEDAKKSGEPVKAPVEVEASRNSNTAPTVKVELPKNAGETEVEIPVSNAKPGTVAVLVHPDGTEEILKASVPTENGIRLTMDGSATVKIIDNSKDFVDTRNHWAREEIDFVSARELVNGMTATRYAPDATATRAQLWTILARQNDANLSGGNTWYEKAQLWSKDKGISDGTNPGATITRAQMVTMLWRTMGQPAAAGRVSFVDVPANSYYAQAVAWAIENGITTGIGGGKFDPNSACTRAQIAAFLARSMK